MAGFIDQILELDRKAPRKQRNTAYRIWKRICAELPDHKVCERTVRFYVQERKTALGLTVHETYVPQSYPWGVEAQVDFHEPRTSVNVFLSLVFERRDEAST